jgi:mono/diheme cytochrome c family protein
LSARGVGLATAVVACVVLAATTAGGQSSASGLEQGKNLFEAQCGMCHLEGGTGTFMLGRRLGPASALLAERTNLDATYVKHVVRNGIVSMPRITRAEVSDAELQAIATYLTRKRGPEQK